MVMTDVMWYMMILGILMPPFLVGFNLLNILDRDKQSVRSRKRLRRRSFSFRVYLFGLSVTITLDFILNYNFIPWVFFCFVFVLLSLCLFFFYISVLFIYLPRMVMENILYNISILVISINCCPCHFALCEQKLCIYSFYGFYYCYYLHITSASITFTLSLFILSASFR